MAVIPYVQEPVPPELQDFYARVQRASRGEIPNIFFVMAHSPRLVEHWWRTMATALSRLSLSPRLRELAILRVFVNTGQAYGFAHHVVISRQLGMSDEEIFGVRSYAEAPCYDELDRLVLRYTDAVTHLAPEAPVLAQELAQRLTHQELVELTFCIGAWNMMSRILHALQVDLEEGYETAVPAWWAQERLPSLYTAYWPQQPPA